MFHGLNLLAIGLACVLAIMPILKCREVSFRVKQSFICDVRIVSYRVKQSFICDDYKTSLSFYIAQLFFNAIAMFLSFIQLTGSISSGRFLRSLQESGHTSSGVAGQDDQEFRLQSGRGIEEGVDQKLITYGAHNNSQNDY